MSDETELTPEQLEAFKKALNSEYTCPNCGSSMILWAYGYEDSYVTCLDCDWNSRDDADH